MHSFDLIFAFGQRKTETSLPYPVCLMASIALKKPERNRDRSTARIPGAELEIFEAGQGGGHFMFHEDAPRFNARVVSVLTA